MWPGEPKVIKESLMACGGKDIKMIVTLFVSSSFKLYAFYLHVQPLKLERKHKTPTPKLPLTLLSKFSVFLVDNL